jgi:aldose 1-epimerase
MGWTSYRSGPDRHFTTLFALLLCLFFTCPTTPAPSYGASEQEIHVRKTARFGTTKDGQNVDLYTITNSHGIEVRAMTYGGIILSLRVPDKNGKLDEVVLGFDNFEGYLNNKPHFGGIIGRYANRIANAKFTLDGVEYHLAKNDGPNTLHGGLKGFDAVLWQAAPFENKAGAGVGFSYTSKDGDESFPGNLKAHVTYTLTDKDELTITYEATTDKATPVNLTQHSYFNLAGEGHGDILGHDLTLNAASFTPVDKNLIPTGEIRPVKGTPLDFTKPTKIGARINDNYEQLILAHGYDQNFVVNGKAGELRLAAHVHEPTSGRVLEVYTTEPGVQFYSGNFLDGTIIGKHGHAYKQREGFALETQHFPDSPNHPEFPSTILRPLQTFHSLTIYRFSVE